MKFKLIDNFTDFGKGLIAGFIFTAIIFGILAGFMYRHRKDREILEYVERQQAIQALRWDYANRDPVEFLDMSGVRGAADGAITDFERRRDEAVQRFRNRFTD